MSLGTTCRRLVRGYGGLAVFVISAFAFRSSFADQYHVPTGSMEPTIQIGDRILVNKMAYDLRIPFTRIVLQTRGEPQRGDIVVFSNPKGEGPSLVKRVVGLPEDEIEVWDGWLRVNGQLLSYSRINAEIFQEDLGDRTYRIRRQARFSVPGHMRFRVPKDRYFVLGDNHDNSADSRIWGFVPRAGIKGEALQVLYSLRFSPFWIPKLDPSRFGKKL